MSVCISVPCLHQRRTRVSGRSTKSSRWFSLTPDGRDWSCRCWSCCWSRPCCPPPPVPEQRWWATARWVSGRCLAAEHPVGWESRGCRDFHTAPPSVARTVHANAGWPMTGPRRRTLTGSWPAPRRVWMETHQEKKSFYISLLGRMLTLTFIFINLSFWSLKTRGRWKYVVYDSKKENKYIKNRRYKCSPK